jgi:SAM-dependent methyltransferase
VELELTDNPEFWLALRQQMNWANEGSDEEFVQTVINRLSYYMSMITLKVGFPQEDWMDNIVDLGGGMGLLAMCLAKYYHARVLIIDKEVPGPVEQTIFSPEYRPQLNTWRFLAENLRLNDLSDQVSVIDMDQLHMTSGEWLGPGVRADMVVSTASWCWHYPWDNYVEQVNDLLRGNGYVAIFAAANHLDQIQGLQEYFSWAHLKEPITFNRLQGLMSQDEFVRWVEFLKPENSFEEVAAYNLILEKACFDNNRGPRPN